jgi:hypothetical protein
VAIVRDYSSRQEEDIETPLPGAVSEADAEKKARELDRGWNEEWERRWKELSDLHERDRHMDAWCAECKKLSEITKTIRRTPANGIDGIAVKLRLITELLRDEDQEDSGPVIKSLGADLKRLGVAV